MRHGTSDRGGFEEDADGHEVAVRTRRLLDMIDVAVAGATGKLGSMVCSLIREQKDMRLVGAVVSAEGGKAGTELYPGVIAVGPDKKS